jgi:hypothetical protein
VLLKAADDFLMHWVLPIAYLKSWEGLSRLLLAEAANLR